MIRPFFHSEMVLWILRIRPLSVVPICSWIIPKQSSESMIENCGFRPTCSASWRRICTPSEWNVQTVSWLTGTLRPSLPGVVSVLPSSSFDTRSRISAAALFVNVTAAMWRGSKPFASIRCAIFCVITRVLPLPAPASTRQGPSR